MTIKVLNLYAGIGGNRRLWQDVEVTAVELNEQIAGVYKSLYPNDHIIVTDAHQYLLEHYNEFDFIWASPPCPTHSVLNRSNTFKHKYPDMKLYQEIIFLENFFKGNWVVENVKPYYEPLIKPFHSGRHCFWSNKHITNYNLVTPKNISLMKKEELMEWLGIFLEKNYYINGNHDERQILRNCVHPKLGLHVFNCIYKTKQVLLNGVL